MHICVMNRSNNLIEQVGTNLFGLKYFGMNVALFNLRVTNCIQSYLWYFWHLYIGITYCVGEGMLSV